MKDYVFKEIDQEGQDTLDAIAGADKFNTWMYETIRPFCKGKILEIGSGIGNISQYFVTAGSDLVLSDIRDSYCDQLKVKFSKQTVLKLDLVHDQFEKEYSHLLGAFDTIFALNVVEHIKDHQLAVDNCYKLLKQGGNLIILVPAYQLIYNRFDAELEHYRRYTKSSLKSLFGQFRIIHSQYFNLIGIAGWIVSGGILRKKTIPAGQMGLYNKLVPFFRIIDKLIFNKMGLSVIVVGTRA